MNLSDGELIEELKKRLDEKNRALYDLRAATKSLEETNSKLRESESLKSDFLSNMKNEINNPLTGLVTLSGELATMEISPDNDGQSEKMYKNIAAMVHFEALNLDYLIRNVLVAAELEAGEVELRITKIDVKSLLADVLNAFIPLIEEHDINVITESPDSLFINSDAEKIGFAMSNLISNGIVFNRKGGNLTISLKESDDKFLFSVCDEGIGINPRDQKSIFDRFKQLDEGRSKKFKGQGLGLSVTQAIADLLEGSIKIESAEGKGSTFTLIIPNMAEADSEGLSVEGTEFFFDDDDDETEF